MTLKTILCSELISIGDLKKNPSSLFEVCSDEVVAVIKHNTPIYYCIKPDSYKRMLSDIDDYKLAIEAFSRLNDNQEISKTSITELRNKYGV